MAKGAKNERDTMCPATMCPYLGLVDGSPWTGDEEGDCEDSCGWWHGSRCIAGNEHDAPLWGVEGPLPPEDMWPACPHADECQWQEQREGPCAPRHMLMMGETIEDTVML